MAELERLIRGLQIQGSAQLKVFKGDVSENFVEFMQDFDHVTRGWEQAQKLLKFRNHLGGIPEETKDDWALLKESFSVRFVPPGIHAMYAAALSNREQGPLEGVAPYATDVSRLVEFTNPTMNLADRENVT